MKLLLGRTHHMPLCAAVLYLGVHSCSLCTFSAISAIEEFNFLYVKVRELPDATATSLSPES